MDWQWRQGGAVLLIALAGCTPAAESKVPAPTPTLESGSAAWAPDRVPAAGSTATAGSGTAEIGQEWAPPAEEILIRSPGSGSRVTNPLHIEGIADPAFEQQLQVRVVGLEGQELASGTAVIQAEVGQRGPFAVDLNLEVEGELNAFIQVAAHSARDGGIVHLASVGVFFSSTGPEELRIGESHPEDLNLLLPRPGDALTGGSLLVEGYGVASFEGTLVIEVQNAAGEVIGMQPVIVQAPEMGLPGLFRAEISYPTQAVGPGRIVVRDLSPAFGGDVHVASVEVILGP